jgi:hypothetical protein
MGDLKIQGTLIMLFVFNIFFMNTIKILFRIYSVVLEVYPYFFYADGKLIYFYSLGNLYKSCRANLFSVNVCPLYKNPKFGVFGVFHSSKFVAMKD